MKVFITRKIPDIAECDRIYLLYWVLIQGKFLLRPFFAQGTWKELLEGTATLDNVPVELESCYER